MAQSSFDPGRYKWREVLGEPGQSYKVRHDYTILGHDVGAGTLDMVVRWADDGGHCPIHRHVATTTILLHEGEQHLRDLHPDGRQSEPRIRRAGDYALTVDEPTPHLECGGKEGGLAFFGCHSNEGRLYEILDDDLNLVIDVTIEVLVADFNENAR